MAKAIYTFGDGKAEGNAGMRNLLGGKGANLAEMNLLGMPVPPDSQSQQTFAQSILNMAVKKWWLTSRKR